MSDELAMNLLDFACNEYIWRYTDKGNEDILFFLLCSILVYTIGRFLQIAIAFLVPKSLVAICRDAAGDRVEFEAIGIIRSLSN